MGTGSETSDWTLERKQCHKNAVRSLQKCSSCDGEEVHVYVHVHMFTCVCLWWEMAESVHDAQICLNYWHTEIPVLLSLPPSFHHQK